jgi:isochorismate synthase
MKLSLCDRDAFALYRLPHEEDYRLVWKKNAKPARFSPMADHQPGFVFHPFVVTDEFPQLFIEAENQALNPEIDFQTTRVTQAVSTNREDYLKQAADFIRATRTSFQKLVLSRVEVYPNPGMDLFSVFMKMHRSYPEAFVYLFNHPASGTWMGASPEILLKERNGTCETFSLAGTRKLDNKGQLTSPWTEKEREEQQLVTRYIEQVMDDHRMDYQLAGPTEHRAGKLMHLKSIFRFDGGSAYPEELIRDLHPTPAVCGIPKEEAVRYIQAAESHHRAYYTGFLGPVGIQAQTDLYVNLRCLQLSQNQFVLYMGGGITASSEPDSEWSETVFKAETMRQIIQKH